MSGVEGETPEAAIDLEGRQLCSDGSCVGVIGDDGRCKVCGAPAGPPTDGDVGEDRREAAPDRDVDDEGGADDDLASRQLCPDGNCVGVIGADGRCRVCGAQVGS
jgi:hypothetical protein